MKFFCLFFIAVTFGNTLNAQTNSATTVRQAKEQPPTQIFSDNVDIDLKTRTAVYRGHVRVDSPQMKMTSGIMTAVVPESGSKIESVVAEQNVVMDTTDEKGQTNRATGEKVVYTCKVADSVTNEVVELTGNPRLESAQGTLTGDVIVWDRINNKLRATNPKMVFRTTSGSGLFPEMGEKAKK